MKDKTIDKECKHHGLTEFVLGNRKAYRCRKCVVDAVTKARQKRKKFLVDYLGGKCKICNYNRCIWALQFHHLNPKDKNFGISSSGACRSLSEMIEEIEKCILLCANCHAEFEAGLFTIPI